MYALQTVDHFLRVWRGMIFLKVHLHFLHTHTFTQITTPSSRREYTQISNANKWIDIELSDTALAHKHTSLRYNNIMCVCVRVCGCAKPSTPGWLQTNKFQGEKLSCLPQYETTLSRSQTIETRYASSPVKRNRIFAQSVEICDFRSCSLVCRSRFSWKPVLSLVHTSCTSVCGDDCNPRFPKQHKIPSSRSTVCCEKCSRTSCVIARTSNTYTKNRSWRTRTHTHTHTPLS